MCTCARGEHDPITCPARRWFGQVLFFKLSQRFEIILFCLFIRLLMKTDVLFGIVNAIWASAIRNRIIKACGQKNNNANILKLMRLPPVINGCSFTQGPFALQIIPRLSLLMHVWLLSDKHLVSRYTPLTVTRVVLLTILWIFFYPWCSTFGFWYFILVR